MKYCSKCGAEMEDNATVCPKCNAPVEQPVSEAKPAEAAPVATSSSESGLKIVAKIFMILGCISGAACFLIPLAWCIPMTVSYFNHTKNHQPVSTGFKVCALLFVSIIAGIVMLVDDED